MKYLTRIFAVILAVTVLFTLLPAPVQATAESYSVIETDEVTASGTYGANLTWSLTTNGKLTISGIGAMENYISSARYPWDSYRSSITSVVIEDGITNISEYAFQFCSNLISITIPDSVSQIGKYAFWECNSLSSITLPDNLTTIAHDVFYYCTSLTSLTIPSSVTTISHRAFWCAKNLKEIKFCGNAPGIGSSVFYGVTATVYYPADNSTWTSSKQAAFGGSLTWVAYSPDEIEDEETWERIDGFNFYMNYPSNYLTIGDNVELHVGYYVDGSINSVSKKYIYTVSDSDCINIVNKGWSDKYGQMLLVTANKEGSATITVTNPDDGESSAIELYVVQGETGWNFYNIPQTEIEKGRITNFYNYGGLVVDEFAYSQHVDETGNVDYYEVTMDVFNSNNLYGAVTSYYPDGSIYGYYVIDKMSDYDTSFVSSLKSLYYSSGDLFYLLRNEKYYSGKSITKKTNVTIKVPLGGHLSISNNRSASQVVNLVNWCGLVFDMSVLMGDFADMDTSGDLFDIKYEVLNKTLTEIMTDETLKKNLLKCLEKAVTDTCKSGDLSADNIIEVLSAINNKLIQFVSVDLVSQIEKKICSIGGVASSTESILKKVLPTGWLIDLLYTTNDGLDFALFLNQYCRSTNKPVGIYIYAPINPSDYKSNGIAIESENDYSDAVIHVYTVVDDGIANIGDDTFPKETSYYGERYQTYSITMYKNGAETQPDSTVMVKIPLPNGFNRAAIKVYRNNEDGSLSDMGAYVADGYVVFETDHFSYYSVVDESEPDVAEDLKFSGASLTLYHNLAINYKVDKALFEETGYENPYVIFERCGVQTVVKDYTIEGNRYVFTFHNIAPNQMNDIISATLYATYDGIQYASQLREYSVAEYCYSMLDLYAADEYAELRTLLVDLLHYGAASQTYTGYKTDALVNASLTATQLQWGTRDEPTLGTVLDTAYKTVENPIAIWKGAGLNLQEAVSIRLKFTTESIDGLSVKIESEENTWTIASDKFLEEDGVYYVYFTGLDAGQMRQSVYLTIYDGDTPVSNTVCYSIESYAYEKQNSTITGLSELVKAMMKYGDSAYAYVH